MQLSPSLPLRLGFALAFGMTDIGTVRSANEDNFLVEPELGLVAVADGMGGHADGEVASAGALTALAHYLRAAACDGDATVPNFRASRFDPVQLDADATWTDDTMRAMIALHDAVEYANDRVYKANLAHGRADGGGMGTTLTGIWQPAPHAPLFVFHVGDSRLYRLRDGRLTQLTRDQTMYQQALDAGFERNLPPRNLLLQALGPAPDIRPELLTAAAQPGDLYLLCSDGLYGACPDQEIAALLARATPESLPALCADLIDTAKRDGSRDNITAVLVHCGA
jgi:PPM family protein phosphatase